MTYIVVCVCFCLLGFALALALDVLGRGRWKAAHARVEGQCQRYIDELAPLRGEAKRLHALAVALEGERYEARHNETFYRKCHADAVERIGDLGKALHALRDERSEACAERDTARAIAEEVIGERNAFREAVQGLEEDNARLRAQRAEAEQQRDGLALQLRGAEDGHRQALAAALSERDAALFALRQCEDGLAEARGLYADADAARTAALAHAQGMSTELGRERLRAARVAAELIDVAQALRRRPE